MNNQKKNYIQCAQSGKYDVCIWGAGFLGTQKGLQMLIERDIQVDYYCDNNSSLWGKKIVKDICCISPKELQARKEKVVCFLFVTNVFGEEILVQLKKMGIERIVLFDDLFIEEKEKYFPFMKNRVVFYTCIVGDYDNLEEPLSVCPDCDYYVISDVPPQKESIFQYIDISRCLPGNVTDNTKKNRYCKINAHKIFPQYRYSIYFDGQFQLQSAIVKYVEQLPKTGIVAFCENYWSSTYMEAMRILLNKRDSEEVIMRQMKQYWLEGLPEEFGSKYCGILIREHNNPICKKLMEDWWEQIEQFSKRDQISFPYIIWKNGYTMADVKTVTDKFSYEGEYWKLRKTHNKPRLVHNGRIIY